MQYALMLADVAITSEVMELKSILINAVPSIEREDILQEERVFNR
jgi:hypothetical protein